MEYTQQQVIMIQPFQLNEKYNINTILYKQQQFNTYKSNQKKINIFNNDREQRLDNILFDNKPLLKTKIEFYTKEKPNEKNVIRQHKFFE